MVKKQVLLIGGGNVYKNEDEYEYNLVKSDLKFSDSFVDWKKSLQDNLGFGFEVLIPIMPSKENAKYKYWKIQFNKLVTVLKSDCVIIAHSLGSAFLIKYLIQNPNFIIDKVIFISPAFSTEDLYDFRSDPKEVNIISNQINEIIIYHSKDDFIVPLEESILLNNLLDGSKLEIFENYGHFFGFADFPEIIKELKAIK